MAKRTPLFDTHVAAGARIVDFGGWDMPLHYGSQIEEHHAVRRGAGMFDVSHMLTVDLRGPGSLPFLRRVLGNDPAKLHDVGASLYTCLLNDKGGIIDDLIVCHVARARYRIVLNAATADSDLAWLDQRRGIEGFAADIAPRRDLAMIAVQGPQAREAVWRTWPELGAATEPLATFRAVQTPFAWVSRTGYTGEDGFELTLDAGAAPAAWAQLASHGVTPCGLGARDTLRVEAGLNLYGQDMDATTTPFETGLGWTVDLRSARDFLGRRAIEGVRVARMRAGLVLEGRGVLRGHMPVYGPSGEGVVTSGTFSPTLGVSIALARLPRPADGRMLRPGERVEVDVRGQRVPARIADPPFVRHGRILVQPDPSPAP